MKAILFAAAAALLLTGGAAVLAADELSSALQRGLFEEEANQDLEAAIQSYKDVVSQFGRDRKLAATAIYRLGECYRKQGKTNEAVAHYERIVREFADVPTLATLSRQNLAGLGAPAGAVARGTSADPAALLTADEAQEVQRIKTLIANSPDLINASLGNGVTRLHQAASAGQLVVARFLLDNAAQVNARDDSGSTPLHEAAKGGHKAMVQLLIERKANVAAADSSGETPLHKAANRGFQSVTEALLGAGADPNARERRLLTPLHAAVNGGHQSMAALLVAKGADVRAAGNDGWTSLHAAAAKGHTDLAAFLVEKGADINARSSTRSTPLFAAVEKGHLETARLLLSKGADPNVPQEEGDTALYPLHHALFGDRPEMLSLLLANKANPDMRLRTKGGENGYTPLLLAIMRKMEPCVEALLQCNADVNIPDAYGNAPLHCALGQPRILDLILAAKPDVNARNQAGDTPLHWAAGSGLGEASRKLAAAGGLDLNARDNEGITPLHIAVLARDRPMVDWLLQSGADPNIADNERRTPLDWTRGMAANSGTRAPNVVRLSPVRMPTPPPIRTPGAPATGPSDPIAEALKQQGALVERPEMDRIKIGRGTKVAPWPVFRKGANDWNRFTLLEGLGAAYRFLDRNPEGSGRSAKSLQELAREQPFAFPDLSRIQIRRPVTDPPGWKTQVIDVAEILKTGDCSKDVPLAWGDVVEVPEADHLLNEIWEGFPVEVVEAFNRCWSREVKLVVKGEPASVKLGALYSFAPTPPGTPRRMQITTEAPLWLKPVLQSSRRLLASSDLSRIKVTRNTPGGGPREYLFDCSDDKPAPDFWLRDGDLIEVPDKTDANP